jgi:predicted CopG family antitoxin
MTKPVTLSDVAYEALVRIKGKNMSFSDAVLKLIETSKGSRDFTRFAGAFSSDYEELEKFKKQIEEDRLRNTEGS